MLYVILGLFALSIFNVVLLKYVPVYYTPLMLRRSWEAAREGRTIDMKKKWVPIDKISPNAVQAVVAAEDNYFRGHYGFSWEGMLKAMEKNKIDSESGKNKIRGGSTISQQCAKNVFTFGYRNYFRKAIEAYYTVLIEWIWGKQRIMEVYLNVIEMGDGVFGIEACSQTNFQIPALELTRRQAALIAVCLPSPRKFSIKNPSSYIRGRQTTIAALMTKIGPQQFDNASLKDARKRYRNRSRK
ncbi:MAG TPA: monofunctional biosynthetic peptidoglycan transglycosylase [Bacteroidales bacterium]|nr:monofunctional biosynthetic peptidoglycan transglycosylase [Bacteroidales bacterium]